MEKLESVVQALRRRGYEAMLVTREEAVAFVRGKAAAVQSVGWGGSETVKALGLREALAATGVEIRDHRTDCDLFLLSANALTTGGLIVNIDGTGNRVAASIYGPKQVVYVVGSNKLVDGGIEDAIRRVKREACPPNCRRLGKRTPCAEGGCPALADPKVLGPGCDSPDRICKATVVFERPPSRTPTTVLLIDEPLGY